MNNEKLRTDDLKILWGFNMIKDLSLQNLIGSLFFYRKKQFFFILFIYLTCIYSYSIVVGVSIPPQKFFVEKIAQNSVSVVSMIKPGMDPHTFSVTPQQMIKLSKADIYFAIGIEFEETLLNRVKNINPDIKIIHLDKNVDKIEMIKIHDHYEVMNNHKHKNEKIHEKHKSQHHHGKLDPHIWLSIKNVKNISKIIYQELIKFESVEKNKLKENFDNFILNIELLNIKIKKLLNKSIKERAFVVFHPAWGYFAKDYDLEQIPVEVEGKEPSPIELKSFIDLSKKKNIKTLFIEGDSVSKSAQSIAEYIDAHIISLYPLSEDWDSNLLYTAEKISDSLK